MTLIAVLIAVGAVTLIIPRLRTRLVAWLRLAREATRVLRSPSKLVQLFGGNLLSQVLFAATLGTCVRAFGFDVPLSSLILINSAVTLFAGLVAVPGDIGVSEAGLSLGLTRAGVPADTALAIALTYPFATAYLPPIGGWRSYRWLVDRRYL